jgi:multidrug resistance efflux pump
MEKKKANRNRSRTKVTTFIIKIIERIPVKIALEKGEDPNYFLRIGMSVVPTILVE